MESGYLLSQNVIGGRNHRITGPTSLERPSSPHPPPNHQKQRITALPLHQSTGDFFNGIRNDRSSMDVADNVPLRLDRCQQTFAAQC
jgi:hypothetical protein